jgi:hypothetical protein
MKTTIAFLLLLCGCSNQPFEYATYASRDSLVVFTLFDNDSTHVTIGGDYSIAGTHRWINDDTLIIKTANGSITFERFKKDTLRIK